MNGPYKICKRDANTIREIVGMAMDVKGRVPEDVVKTLRELAERSHQFHQELDPHFLRERCGGPAVPLSDEEKREQRRLVEGWSESWREMKGGQCNSTRQERLG